MILQALTDYYRRLAEDDDPNTDIAPFGWSRQKIAFEVVLRPDGTLVQVGDMRVQKGKKLIPSTLLVCGNSKPSGSGINPGFLWDNPAYMLGYKPDDKKPQRTRETFEAFRDRHLELESAVDDEGFTAVCRFLEAWNPDAATEHETLVEIGTGFGQFRLAEGEPIHERVTVRDWWNRQISENRGGSDVPSGQCLVSGTTSPFARIHEPKIKGVYNAQSAGALLVSYNDKAFCSYGREEEYNAPVSEQAAFEYCTALNRLLADPSRRFQLGDASVVFWTESPSPIETIFTSLISGPPDAEDNELVDRLNKTLTAIATGSYPAELGEPETNFFCLGLSPNAARISVRFWMRGTLGALVDNLRQHFTDLEITHSDNEPDHLHPWRLLRETARESKEIPPLLGGALLRSVLTGQRYPLLLLSSLIRRIRADQSLRYARAAGIKACLNRNSRLGFQPLSQELSVSLDPDRTDPAYCLGRLFAELEKTQEDALPGTNATIKDRYFGAASATPASVFPRLIRMSQHHLGKLDPGPKTWHEKRIQEICGKLDGFANHLDLRDQGLFAIGYYHQRADLFTKKSDTPTEATSEAAAKGEN